MEKTKEKIKYIYLLVEKLYEIIKKLISVENKNEEFQKIYADLVFFLGENYEKFLKKFIEVAITKIYSKTENFNKLSKDLNKLTNFIIENLKIFIHTVIVPESYQARVALSLDMLKLVNEK